MKIIRILILKNEFPVYKYYSKKLLQAFNFFEVHD